MTSHAIFIISCIELTIDWFNMSLWLPPDWFRALLSLFHLSLSLVLSRRIVSLATHHTNFFFRIQSYVTHGSIYIYHCHLVARTIIHHLHLNHYPAILLLGIGFRLIRHLSIGSDHSRYNPFFERKSSYSYPRDASMYQYTTIHMGRRP